MSYEESAIIQKREALAAAELKIASLHDECVEADEGIKAALLRKINKGRECGVELIAYKKQAKHGSWESLFIRKSVTGYRFGFSVETAKIYMRFATAHPQPITEISDAIRCVKDAFIASGALSATIGHGSQMLHSFDFGGLIAKKTFDFKAAWGEQVKKEPFDTWTEDRKEIVRDELKWYAERYVELGGRL